MEVYILSNLPYDYSQINIAYASHSPSTLHTKNNRLFVMFYMRLMRMAFNLYDFKIPKNWNKFFLLWCIFYNGYFAVFKTQKYGIIPMNCTINGFDLYYQPAWAVIVNPNFYRQYNLRIGETCELGVLQPDYGNITDIVGYYAEQMTITSETVSLNTVASRLSHVFVGNSKGSVDGYKKMMDNLINGDIAAFIDQEMANDEGKITHELLNSNVKNNFITLELQDALRNWEYEFCRVIGIPTQGYNKKERMVVDEVNSSNIETAFDAEERLECLQESFERIRKMFNYSKEELNVTWKHNPMEEGGSNGKRSQTVGSRSV